ncbi:MAG: hypothetical protein ACI8R4_000004 [Paracoccaceae bacterium]|jgi:hypothetical protein
MKTVSGLILALGLIGAAGLAQAQQLEQWGTAAGWDVMIDPSLGDGCLIQAAYQDGSVVRIGFDRLAGDGYITAFNDAWGDIEEGGVYDIQFVLDGEEFEGEAIGIYLNDVPGADIHFDSTDFLFAIAEKINMTLYSEYGEVMSIDLGGTYTGLEAVIACQEEMG